MREPSRKLTEDELAYASGGVRHQLVLHKVHGMVCDGMKSVVQNLRA